MAMTADGLVDTVCDSCGVKTWCVCCDQEVDDELLLWFECERCLARFDGEGDDED
jgi:hypothetical protein